MGSAARGALAELAARGEQVVSSQTLGEMLEVTPAQIRKDLSYFGRFGKQGRGYNVQLLLAKLREILGLDRQWRVIVVGVGLSRPGIGAYGGVEPQGGHIVAAFDAGTALVGKEVGRVRIRSVDELDEFLRREPVDIGIVAVPARVAQEVVDRLVAAGVRAILNYAPTTAHVPSDVSIRHIDPVLAMQSMTYHLKQRQSSSAK